MSIVITNTDFLNGNAVDGQTLDNPILCYSSFYSPEQITSTTNTGGVPSATNPPSNLWNPDTYSFWEGQGLSPGPLTLHEEYIEIDNINDDTFNYIALAGHNLSDILIDSDANATIIISPEVSSDGFVWSSIDFGLFVQDITTNDPIVFYFDDETANYVRIRICCDQVTAVNAPRIAHLKAGQATVLQRREFSGVASGNLYKVLRRTQSMSENGQYLGQIILSDKRSMSVNQKNNTPVFIRNNIKPFIDHTQGLPQIAGGSDTTFFYSWRPTSYPDDVLYGWTMDTITPQHQGGDSFGGRMDWSFEMECLS